MDFSCRKRRSRISVSWAPRYLVFVLTRSLFTGETHSEADVARRGCLRLLNLLLSVKLEAREQYENG